MSPRLFWLLAILFCLAVWALIVLSMIEWAGCSSVSPC